jgi:hypothetical protein
MLGSLLITDRRARPREREVTDALDLVERSLYLMAIYTDPSMAGLLSPAAREKIHRELLLHVIYEVSRLRQGNSASEMAAYNNTQRVEADQRVRTELDRLTASSLVPLTMEVRSDVVSRLFNVQVAPHALLVPLPHAYAPAGRGGHQVSIPSSRFSLGPRMFSSPSGPAVEQESCQKWNTNGICSYGARCKYAHRCSSCGSLGHPECTCSKRRARAPVPPMFVQARGGGNKRGRGPPPPPPSGLGLRVS